MPRQKLTDRGIRSLKAPASGQLDIWDAHTPGFGIRIGKGGRKAFVVGTRVNCRYRRFTLAPAYPALSLADARVRAAKIIKDAEAGIDPEAAKAAERVAAIRRRRHSFGAVADDFMRDHAKNLRTRGEMQRKLDVELLPHWAERPIASITRADIKALLREKARSSVSAADRLLPLISKLFAWALDEEIIQSSPAMRLPRHGASVERERALSPDEISCVWRAFSGLGYPFGGLLKMLLLTAQRRGEVAGMRWDEVDSDGWLLPAARVKTKQGHRVPLSSLALEVLGGLPRIGELVFSVRGDQPLQAWSRAKVRVDRLCPDVAPWRIHDLRRTAATQMRSLGVDRLVVSKILGHAEGGVTRIYDRYAVDTEKAAALERWANRLRAIVEGRPSHGR
jgi:integrase